MNQEATGKTYLDVEDLQVYQKLCQLYLEICDLSHAWPAEERYELGSQIRRSSNSSPAQLAEKHDDRHVRNKVEGVNRSRGEAGETIHHLFMAKLKGYIKNDVYATYRERYKQCIRMLNGLEKSLEQHLSEKERRWAVAETADEYGKPNTEHRTPIHPYTHTPILMNINPSTTLYAVLGHPIRHSLSPRMQNAAFEALTMDAVYLAFDVPPEKLMQTLPVMADLGFVGINLTVPLKEVAFRGLADLDEAAQHLGSVNTIKINAGGLKGFSTDGEGFLRAIREAFDLSVKGLSLFLLGCGGAGRAVAFACATAGAGRLMLADADRTRLAGLEADLRALGLKTDISAVGTEPQAWRRACREAELVVHATPMGMHTGESSVLPPDAFHRDQRVYDLIYTFPETVLMRAAREAGARAANGLGMLLHQGALSFSIWTGREAPVAVMRRVLEEAVYGKMQKAE